MAPPPQPSKSYFWNFDDLSDSEDEAVSREKIEPRSTTIQPKNVVATGGDERVI